MRKLLGDDAAVQLHTGKLSLHAHKYWIDTWALEQALGEVQGLLKDASATASAAASGSDALQPAIERVIALYRALLLQQDHDYAWAAAPRQQLFKSIGG